MLLPHSPERLAEVQAALAAEARGKEPEIRNLGPVQDLSRELPLEFGGRRYRVAPVPFASGVQLLELQARVRALQDRAGSPDSLTELRAILEEAVALFPRLARPAGWRGWVWRCMPNPFRKASEFEVGALIGFFSGCRMKSSVRHPAPATAPRR